MQFRPGDKSAIAALLALAGALSLGAQGLLGGGRLEASLGYGGYSVPGRWNPLWISRSGGSEGALVEVLRLDLEGREIGRETFPLPSGSRLECPVSIDGELASLSVRIREGAQVLAEARLGARDRVFPGHIALACGLTARVRLAIASALMPAEPIQAIALDPADLPANGLDYDSVSVLAMKDSGSLLSPAQREALLAWIGGGGRLAIASAREGEDSLYASLLRTRAGSSAGGAPAGGGITGGERPAEAGAAGYTRTAFGLGSIIRITRDLSELPEAATGAFWRKALSLSPYGEGARIYIAAATRWSQSVEGQDGTTRGAKAALVLAVLAWVAASLGAAAMAREKRPARGGRARGDRAGGDSSSGGRRNALVWPIAAVAAACLALVFSGAGALDRALARGASARILATVLPDSGAAIVSASFSGTRVPDTIGWAAAKAYSPLPLDFAGETETGAVNRLPSVPASWNHLSAKASFSLRESGSSSGAGTAAGAAAGTTEDELAVAGVLAYKYLEGSSLPRFVPGSFPRGGREPPELESSGPMGFVSAGPQGDPGQELWWGRDPGKAWTRLSQPPAWLADDYQWLEGLRSAGGGCSLLLGQGPAPSLGLDEAGGPIRQICWALPIPGGAP
jgi:hypothetical protein